MKSVNIKVFASNQEIRGNVTSDRLRKAPVTKADDLLW